MFCNPFVPGNALIESRPATFVWVHGTRLLVRFFQPIIKALLKLRQIKVQIAQNSLMDIFLMCPVWNWFCVKGNEENADGEMWEDDGSIKTASEWIAFAGTIERKHDIT